MSQIQAALRAQIEEKNRPFICIKGLIEAMVNIDVDCTFIEAANILGSVIDKNIKSIKTLCYFRRTNNNEYYEYIKFFDYYKTSHNYSDAQNSHFEYLIILLNKKTFNESENIYLKDYGVERSEFSKLLAEVGILINLDASIESKPIPTVLIVDPSPPHEPIKTEALDAFVEPAPAQPGWSLKTSIERAPGYRWPLYQVLKAAHIARQPCPKARNVLEAWELNPPPDLRVMPDGVKYNDGLGNQKEADLKAIGQAIKNLMN